MAQPIMLDGPPTVYTNAAKAWDVVASLRIHEKEGWRYNVRPLGTRRFVIDVFDEDNQPAGTL